MSRFPVLVLLFALGSQGAAAAQTPAATPQQVNVTVSSEGLRIPLVRVELWSVDRNIALGRTATDTIGQAAFPDVPPGRYLVRASRDGFADAESAPFSVEDGGTTQVLVEMRLAFASEQVEVVVPGNSPTGSLQPVAVSDVLSGARMDIEPLEGDDFQFS